MKIKIFCRCRFFLPGRAKDLSAPLYMFRHLRWHSGVEIFRSWYSSWIVLYSFILLYFIECICWL